MARVKAKSKGTAKAKPAARSAKPKAAASTAAKRPANGKATGGHFTPELFRFLRDLAANNNKAWFEANRGRYERDVREPLLSFILDFAPRLRTISRAFVADARSNGGSMFRIYRDTRFSKNKSPYKTVASAQFRHQAGKDVHAPGFYLHLEPGQVFVGCGLWHPEPAVAGKIREAIVAKAAAWKKITTAKEFLAVGETAGDFLVRPPRGFDPEHPLIEDLKRKDFIFVASFSEKDAVSAGFLDQVARTCATAGPYMRFLTEAVGLEY